MTTDETNPPTSTDEDITEDTLDRVFEAPGEQVAADEAKDKGKARDKRIADLMETSLESAKAAAVQREATRKERLTKKAACDADRTLAVALLYEAVHRAEAFAHEVVITERMITKLKALAEAGQDVAESIAMLEARNEIAQEALPALLDLREHRKRILDLANLADDLDQPSTEELWTLSGGAAALVTPYIFQWAVAKAEAAEAAAVADPGSDPIPAGPTP